VARLLTADQLSLTGPERVYVAQLLAPSPAVAAASDLARRFGALVRNRDADALTPG